MKVLFVTHYGEMLGANHSMLQLMIELKQKGVETTVLLPNGIGNYKSPLVVNLEKEGIPYIYSPIRIVKHPSTLKVLLNYFYECISNRKTLRIMSKHRDFDLIHSNSSVIRTGKFLSEKFHVPHVWHLREFGDLDYNFKTPFGKWFQRIIYGGNNNFIAISQKILSHFKSKVGKQPINVIYNGIKPTKYDLRKSNSVPHFCIVGLLHPNKRQMDIIKAADILANNRNIHNFHITIVGGGDQNYINKIKSFLREKGLNSLFTLTGQINDVGVLLGTMDVGVMSSSNEAFGRVTVEYMMSGLAVIASDGGANEEIVEDNKTGIIYRTGDYNALADKMQLLIDNPDMIRSFAVKGQRRALEKFSSSTNTENVFNLYKKILNC